MTRKGMIKMQELSGQVTQTLPETPPLTDPRPADSNREVRFFTAPKPVIKKTQLSITAFQLTTAAAVCLLLKLCALFAPELFANIHLYLTHLFRW